MHRGGCRQYKSWVPTVSYLFRAKRSCWRGSEGRGDMRALQTSFCAETVVQRQTVLHMTHRTTQDCGRRAARRSLLWYHRTCLSQPEVSSARWLSRHSAPPSCLDPREQPPIMLNFVFQGLPLWGGPQGQPRLSSQIIVYARKPGIQVFLMIWVLILFLLRLTRYSYDDSSIMLF